MAPAPAPAPARPGLLARVRRLDLSGLPLATRLVATLLLLLAVGLVLSGAAGVGALQGYLTARVDRQLVSVVHDGAALGPGYRDGGPARLNTYFVAYRTPDSPNTVLALANDQSPPVLPALTPGLAEERAGQPFSVPSADGSGQWRVLVTALPDGSGVVTAVALNTDDVRRTVSRLLLVDLLCGAAVLALLGGAALLLVRSNLRPLRRVEQTAAAIAGGDLTRRVAVAPETTEVGRLAAALNTMLARIEDAFAAQRASEAGARASEARMRQFVADASHELRTPLTSIRGFAELYRQGAVPEPDGVPAVMLRMETEARRMGQLVDEMLLLARLDQERPLESAAVDLQALAADVVAGARGWAGGHPLTLSTEGGPPLVLGDDALLRQVLVNLVRNAVVHTPDGTRVDVRLRSTDRLAEMVVSDDGPGLTQEQAAQVFDRFYRADTARTRAAGGSGLGLSIVSSLVHAHGGGVRVDSEPGRGTTFTVELPRLTRTTPEPVARAQPV